MCTEYMGGSPLFPVREGTDTSAQVRGTADELMALGSQVKEQELPKAKTPTKIELGGRGLSRCYAY